MADNTKQSFIVYADDIKETIDELTDEQVGALFRGMVNYQITGKEPGFTGALRFAFIPIRQQMERNNSKWARTRARRSEAGRKGGIASGAARQKGINEANEANEANASKTKQTKQNEANEAVNVNVDVNVKGEVNVPHSFNEAGGDPSSLPQSLVSYLNEKAGTKYRTSEALTERISELIQAGYSLDDMRRVIDLKVAEWLGDEKMRSYLRPRTLFGDKFEEYASAPEPMQSEDERAEQERAERIRQSVAEKRETLEQVRAKMAQARADPATTREQINDFRDYEAILIQQIETLEGRTR